MITSKLASQAELEILSGLSGITATLNLPIEALEDELVMTRLAIIHKYTLQNLVPLHDLATSINCIELDCASLDKCCEHDPDDELVAHFEIPQLANVLGDDAILWLGTTDKQIRFKVYTSPIFKYHKYKRRGKNKPFVYIDITPNKNNLYDAYLFNAPLLERVSIVAIFKDPRQFEEGFSCCNYTEIDNLSDIELEAKDTVVAKYIKYYRSLLQQPLPNNQNPGGAMLGVEQPQS